MTQTTENRDLIHVFDLEANFTGERIKRGMKGFTSDTNKIVWRSLSTGIYHFISNDTVQSLLNVSQTYSAAKVFGDRLTIGNVLTHGVQVITSIVDNSNLNPADTNTFYLNNSGTPGALHTAGILAGVVEHQVIEIWANNGSAVELDGTVSGSASIVVKGGSILTIAQNQFARLRWDAVDSNWVVLDTNGTVS